VRSPADVKMPGRVLEDLRGVTRNAARPRVT
jgi:hypothetical protein